MVYPSWIRTGVPKIVIDPDQGSSRLKAIKEFKRTLNNDLVGPVSSTTNSQAARKKECTDDKASKRIKHTCF